MLGSTRDVTLYLDELCFTIGAVKQCIEQYEEALEETKINHPGCEAVYIVALNGLRGALETLEKAQ